MRKEEFLIEYFKDAQEEMRWRRNLEFTFLRFHLIYMPAILSGLFALLNSSISKIVCLLVCIGAIIFILLITVLIVEKIEAEHEIYSKIGKIIKKIWEYFEFFNENSYFEFQNKAILPTPKNKEDDYGEGDGCKKTIRIIWLISWISIIIIVIITTYVMYILNILNNFFTILNILFLGIVWTIIGIGYYYFVKLIFLLRFFVFLKFRL
ncbi:MAG: hypothetical protein PHX21_09310 [bacterium]|nr:hypothetical protein [bacterium]